MIPLIFLLISILLFIAFMIDSTVVALIVAVITIYIILLLANFINKINLKIANKMGVEDVDKYKEKIKYARKNNSLDDEEEKQLENALNTALDIRKFEIELYWKRAGYFWGIMGFCAISTAMAPKFEDGSLVAFFLSCLALFISSGFWMANRGSKFWQENWESHVDILEDEIIGPLYRIIFVRNGTKKLSISDAWPFSVSKINMYISFAFIVFWEIMIIYQLWLILDKMFNINSSYCINAILALFSASPNELYFILIIGILVSTCVGLVYMYIKTGSSEIERRLAQKKNVENMNRTMVERLKWYNNH